MDALMVAVGARKGRLGLCATCNSPDVISFVRGLSLVGSFRRLLRVRHSNFNHESESRRK